MVIWRYYDEKEVFCVFPDMCPAAVSCGDLICRAGTSPHKEHTTVISGTTAYCYAYCEADLTTDKVVANVMLYQGSNVVASWSAQGTGSVTISESVPVKKGCEYTMSLTWSVAGQWQRSVFTKGTCPG